MEGSIGIKAAKTGKNQNLKKKSGKTYDAENSPTCRGSDPWGNISAKMPNFKKKKHPISNDYIFYLAPQKDQKKEINGEDNSPTCRRSDI